VSLTDDQLHFDVSAETVSRSTIAGLSKGAKVNLELALLPSDRLGGHIVTGHVDGLGELIERTQVGRSVKMRFRVTGALSRFIAEKGSISIDGVSLTVNTVEGHKFDVNIVPHTLHETTLGAFSVGQQVHIEVDLIARYVERLMSMEDTHVADTLDEALLAKHGFVSVEDHE
jgi:riboflavin synthase